MLNKTILILNIEEKTCSALRKTLINTSGIVLAPEGWQ